MARARHRRSIALAGFTLMEVALAIVIVGVGALALLELSTVCTNQNRSSAELTTAAMLAQHVQEMIADLPLTDPAVGSTHFGSEPGELLSNYDDVDDFDGLVLTPPRDSTRAIIPGMSRFSQRVTVYPVAARQPGGNLSGTAIARSTYTGAVRVTVDVRQAVAGSATPQVIHQLTWIRVEE